MDNFLFLERCVFDGRTSTYFNYGQVTLSFTEAPLGPGVASSPGSLPGVEATLGGAPICEGASTHTSI